MHLGPYWEEEGGQQQEQQLLGVVELLERGELQ